nr:hypothetical protein [Tanacetum cinerariifolium]
MRGNNQYYARMTNPQPHRHVVPTTVLTKSRLVPLTTARPVTAVVSHPYVTRPRTTKNVVTKSHSQPRRTINHRPSPTPSNFPHKVTTVKAPKVNVVKGVKGNCVWKPKCPILDHVSRHTSASMTLKKFDYTDALGRSNNSDKTKKHDDKTKREAKGKSPIELSIGFRNLSEEFEDFSDDSTNEVNAASTLVPAVGQISTNNTNTFSADGPLNTIMDVKSAFLYGTFEEEVYVCQPPGFEDPNYPDKGKIDQTLFIKRQKGDIILVQIYVDDIIFGSTNKDLCKAFKKLMKDKFQMSSTDEINFFLGLQVKQKTDGIFISQDKYVAEILRKFGLINGKSASTLIDTKKPLLKEPNGEDVDVHTYRSMIGSLMYL